MTMSKAQFQQMKSTEAVYIRLSQGSDLTRELHPCSANTDQIPDHKPSQLGMYSSVGDKKRNPGKEHNNLNIFFPVLFLK